MTPDLEWIKVHRIIEGPFHTFDVVDDEGIYEGMDSYFCQALVELPDGTMTEEELHFDEFPDFYEMKAWLDRHIDPYVIEMELISD